MKRPKQLPAVERKTTRCAAVPAGGRVNASGIWDTAWSVLTSPKTYNVASDLASAMSAALK